MQVGALPRDVVEQHERAIRVPGAGDEQDVHGALAEPPHRLVGVLSDRDDVEVGVVRQGLLHLLGVDAGLDAE